MARQAAQKFSKVSEWIAAGNMESGFYVLENMERETEKAVGFKAEKFNSAANLKPATCWIPKSQMQEVANDFYTKGARPHVPGAGVALQPQGSRGLRAVIDQMPPLPKVVPEGTALAHAVREYAREAIDAELVRFGHGLPPLPQLPNPDVYAIGDFFERGVRHSKAFTPRQVENYARSYALDAVRREREECAYLCDQLWTRAGDADQCADAIRSRSGRPPLHSSDDQTHER